MMKREDKLMTMKGADLIRVADNLGIKVACNKARTQLKESKRGVIDRIILVEEIKAESEKVVAAKSALSISSSTESGENGPQMIEKKEPKKERKSRKKKEQTEDVTALLEYVFTEWKNIGGVIKTPGKENAVFRALCVANGRQVIKLMWTAKKISFFVRVEAATVHAEQWQKINYALPFQCMFFNNTEETRQYIKDIFQLVINIDSIRIKKEKKVYDK